MRRKPLLAVAVCTAVLADASASAAFGGEVTGNGDPTAAPDNANSICAFSGQNDGEPPAGRTAENVQSWGQLTKETRDFLTSIGSAPGDACRGGSN
jgi:hypothetical protein